MFYELSEAENILKFYRDYIADASEQMDVFPAFQIAPPLPFIPEDRHGDTFIAMVGVLVRTRRTGRGCVQAVPRRGAGRRRARRTGSVPGAQQRVRRALPGRATAALLEGELREGAHGRGHHGARDSTAPRCRS